MHRGQRPEEAHSGAVRWNAFSWPKTPAPFLLVNADVPIRLADGTAARVSLAQRFPRLDNVLAVTGDQLMFLSVMMNKVGGTKTREARPLPQAGVMEAPNQPVGPSVNLMAFLNKFFAARAGHWGGWEFLTYPVVRQIEFLDDARTKARAKVTIGYSGCDVLLEKVDGAWKATGVMNQWIT